MHVYCMYSVWICICVSVESRAWPRRSGRSARQFEKLLAPSVNCSLRALKISHWLDEGVPWLLLGSNLCLWPSHFTQSHSFTISHSLNSGINSSNRERCNCDHEWGSFWTWKHWFIDLVPSAYIQMSRIGHSVPRDAYHSNGYISSLQGHRTEDASGPFCCVVCVCMKL